MATINELMENEKFLKGLVDVTTPAELGDLFADNDIQLEDGISLEEAFEIVKKQEEAELSETDLDSTNGGIALTVALGAVGAFTAGGAALSFLGGYAYQKYKNWKKR